MDTHGDVHVAAACDLLGAVLGTRAFPTTAAGYRGLLRFLASFGEIEAVGVEGTGSYGSGLAPRGRRRPGGRGEPPQPSGPPLARQGRHRRCHRCGSSGDQWAGHGRPETPRRDRRSVAVTASRAPVRAKARTQPLNQLHSLIVTAPEPIRGQLRDLPRCRMLATCQSFRPADRDDVLPVVKLALRELANRVADLDAQNARVAARRRRLLAQTAPALIAINGVGPDTATTLLLAAGDSPHRLGSLATFAALLGASPIPASSGKTTRMRLNRGGDRLGNAALWRIVITRMATQPDTRAYVERGTKEGPSKPEIIRCLQRYGAREVFNALPRELLT